MISNPLDSPYFLPTLGRVVAIMVPALLVLLALVRFHASRLRGNVLFARWRVWAVIAPIYGLAVLSGSFALLLLLTFLVVQGLREYCALVKLPRDYRRVLIALGLIAAPVAMWSLDMFQLLPILLFMAGTLQLLAFRESDTVRHLAFAMLGWGYIPWFLAHVMLISRYVTNGRGVLLALGLGVALSDIGAFTIGKTLGRHKLAPTVSPNKTWEGSLGNAIGAYLGVGIMAFALAGPHRLLLLTVLPVVIAVGALWGDLVKSSIKREFGVKDFGTWLPGFGGLLDRIDSLMMTAPLTCYVLLLLG